MTEANLSQVAFVEFATDTLKIGVKYRSERSGDYVRHFREIIGEWGIHDILLFRAVQGIVFLPTRVTGLQLWASIHQRKKDSLMKE